MENDSTYLQLWVEESAVGTIVHVRGEIDLGSASSLRARLMQLIGGHPIIVDCSEIHYLDMQGIRVLEECHRQAEQEGQRLVLVGSSPLVRKILAIVKLDQRLPVLHTMEEAINALGQSGRRR